MLCTLALKDLLTPLFPDGLALRAAALVKGSFSSKSFLGKKWKRAGEKVVCVRPKIVIVLL